MDEEMRRDRTLDALELIAGELEKLRLLKEHELGVRIEHEEEDPFVRPNEEGQDADEHNGPGPSGLGLLRASP